MGAIDFIQYGENLGQVAGPLSGIFREHPRDQIGHTGRGVQQVRFVRRLDAAETPGFRQFDRAIPRTGDPSFRALATK